MEKPKPMTAANDQASGTSADWVRGYKWALAGGDPPCTRTGSRAKRDMFMRGYEAGKQPIQPRRRVWDYARLPAAALLVAFALFTGKAHAECHSDNNARTVCTGFSKVKHERRHIAQYADANGNDPRPHAWCGWAMRQWLGVKDRAYNLARNWASFGSRASGPAVGVIVVWSHHVGLIVGRTDSGWIIKSGNDGNAVRERERSLLGVIAYRWPHGAMAGL